MLWQCDFCHARQGRQVDKSAKTFLKNGSLHNALSEISLGISRFNATIFHPPPSRASLCGPWVRNNLKNLAALGYLALLASVTVGA